MIISVSCSGSFNTPYDGHWCSFAAVTITNIKKEEMIGSSVTTH